MAKSKKPPKATFGIDDLDPAGAPAPAAVPTSTGPVPVRLQDGTVGTVPAAELGHALDAGAEVVDQETVHKAETEAKFGGVGGGLAAGAAGFGRGLTLGATDYLATRIGGDKARETLAGLREANPLASTVGEVAGNVAPILASDGVLGAVGSPVRLATGLGEAAGAGVRGALGEGVGVLGKLGKGALEMGVRGAAENAVIGGAQVADEAILGDKDLTAEDLFAGMGKGALLGGALGGAQGVLHGAASLGVDAVHALGESASRLGEGLLQKGERSLAELGEAAERHAGRLGEVAGDAATAIEGAKPGSLLEDISARGERYADEAAYRSVSSGRGQTKLARDAEQRFGSTEAVGRIWREDVPGLVGEGKTFGSLTFDDMKVAARKGKKKFGEEMGRVIDETTERAEKAGALPKAYEILEPIDALAKHLDATELGSGPAVAKLRELARQGERIMGMVDDEGKLIPEMVDRAVTARELHKFRKGVDKLINFSKTTELAGYQDAFKEIRTKLESKLETLINDHAPDAKAVVDYAMAKKKFQAMVMLGDASKMASASSSGNRFFGLGDTLTGGVGAAMGGMVGGMPGAFIGNMAGKAVGKFSRERGSFLAAEYLSREGQQRALQAASSALGDVGGTLRKVHQLESVQAIKNAFESDMGRAVRDAVTERVAPAVRVASRVAGRAASAAESAGAVARSTADRIETIQRQVAVVRALSQNPDLLSDRLQQSTGGMSELGETSGAYAMQAQKAVQFLASKAPVPLPSSLLGLAPTAKGRSPYEVGQLLRYERFQRGVFHPLEVVRDVGRGRASREGVEALRAVYPKRYEDMTTRILDQLATMKSKGRSPSYDKRAQLSVILGQPADWSFEPASIRLLQSAGGVAPQAEGPGPAPAGGLAQNTPARPLDTGVVDAATTQAERNQSA